MMTNFIFYLGISFILLHEMDAIRCHEWRIFPGLSLLNDKLGFLAFMLAHIPLFVFMLSFFGNETFRRGFDVFLIIHVGLHLLFLKHPKNEFKDWISWTIISGAGICGALDFFIYR
jgi:hypothetical protein